MTYFTAFSALVTGAVAWSLWGGEIFPSEPDPTGNPEEWTREEMRRWLAAVSTYGFYFYVYVEPMTTK